MGIKDWNTRKSQSFTFGRSSSIRSSSRREKKQSHQQQCIKLGQRYHDDHDHQNQGSRWKILWMKIKREKQKILSSNHHSAAIAAAYDPEAYSRNFDDGLECREPEYLTHSFSARFADPSRVVLRNRFLS